MPGHGDCPIEDGLSRPCESRHDLPVHPRFTHPLQEQLTLLDDPRPLLDLILPNKNPNMDSERPTSPLAPTAMETPSTGARSSGHRQRRCEQRDRVTVDLRGIGPQLNARAAARGSTVAGAVRSAIVTMLEADGAVVCGERIAPPHSGSVARVTLRISTAHAAGLAERARTADVSQGAYVAELLDGIAPTPRPRDHGEAVSALVDSTRTLAQLGSDLAAHARRSGKSRDGDAPVAHAAVTELVREVRQHLRRVSTLITELTARTAKGSLKPAATASHHGPNSPEAQ